ANLSPMPYYLFTASRKGMPNRAPVRKVQLTFSRQRQPGTAMIDGRDEVVGSAEAERAMADGLDLVVHALDGSVREADLGPGKNSIQVGAQHLCECLERLQLRAHCRVHPLSQMLCGTPGLLVLPEQLEGFFQIPGAHQRRVPANQRR